MYFLNENSGGFAVDGVLPDGAVACSEEQALSGTFKLVDGKVTGLAESEKLDVLKDAKKSELSSSLKSALVGGFFSSALGENIEYPSSEIDQKNLLSAALAGVVSGLWCKQENWKFVSHSPEQIKQVLIDWQTFFNAQQDKYVGLLDDAFKAKTGQKLEKIEW